jgi:hypothetical protein
MSNNAGQISVVASSTIELFATAGVDLARVTVSLHSDAGSPPLVLVNALDGSGVSFALPDDEGATFQFVTDKDPVYIKNLSGSALNLYYYISAV